MPKFLSNVDLVGNQLLNSVAQNLATAPATPKAGMFYFNTGTKRFMWYSGSGWVGADAADATMTGADIVAAINGSSSLIDLDNLPASVGTAITNSHTHSNSAALAAVEVGYTAAMNTKLTGIETGADVTDAVNVGSSVNGTTAKTSLVDNDLFAILNSASSNALAKITFANLKAALKSYNDTLYNKYTHPNHTGEVTSTGDGDTVIVDHVVTNAKLAQVATGTIKGRVTTGTGDVEDLTATQIRTLINVADGANNYSHPTGDGNLHVPATTTTNNGKVLTAGSTAGSLSWATPAVAWANVSSKPTSTTAQIDGAVTNSHTHSNKALLDSYTQTEANLADAVSKKHTQNTDTGTSSATFTVGASGVKIKNAGGTELQVRNNADTDYGDLRVKNLVVEGTTTTINSNEVNLGDSQILLNADITASAQNSDGGIAVKRLMADNTTRKDAELNYNNSTNRWEATFGNVAGTLVTAGIASKVVAVIGDGTNTTFQIDHNLNTQDLAVTVRESAAPFAKVETDIEFETVNRIKVSFSVAPTAGQYTVVMVG